MPIQKLTISWSGSDFTMEVMLNVDSSSDKHKQHVPCPNSRADSVMVSALLLLISNATRSNTWKTQNDSQRTMSWAKCRLSSACCIYLYFFFSFLTTLHLNCQTLCDDSWCACTKNYNQIIHKPIATTSTTLTITSKTYVSLYSALFGLKQSISVVPTIGIMFRFQSLCRNVNVLKQVRCWPLERHTVSTQFYRAIANERLQNAQDSAPTSKTDIGSLKQLVQEQVSFRLHENWKKNDVKWFIFHSYQGRSCQKTQRKWQQ